MTLEIEGKFKVSSHDAVRERLVAAGARFVSRVLEVNTILDTPERRLLTSGCGLRVRTCTGEGCATPATVTYKGRQQAGAVKIRPEIETAIADADAMLRLLAGLGFTPAIVFEKRRETWTLQGAIVELDEVPRLGLYVEVEALDEAAVQRVQAAIGLADQPCIRLSYIALLVDHAQANGLPTDQITFA